jgi:CubicO group peptidase (beta-lactamase class C family)
MASAIPQERLPEIVREARAGTGVPAVAVGLLVDGRFELVADGPVDVDTPFRIASITKWFTASLAALTLDLDAPAWECVSARRLLSHTADLRSNQAEALPEQCRGLWSYSNAGYVLAGKACEAAAGASYSDAVRERLLEPLGLQATSFDEPRGAAPGHVQAGGTGHRPAPPVEYRASRRAAGGLWSTVGDLLRFGEHQLGGPGRCLRRSSSRYTSRRRRRSAGATASAAGDASSPAVASPSTTRARSGAISRSSCSFPRRRRRSPSSRTAGAAAA